MGSRGWRAGALLLVMSPLGVAAQPISDPAARTPAVERLKALKDRALQAQRASPEQASPEERAAWQALYDAAILVRLGPQRLPHPLAGHALVGIAQLDDRAGDTAGSLRRGQEALPILRPFRDNYHPELFIQASSLVGYALTSLGKPSAAVVPLGDVADWYDGIFARLPADQRERDDIMTKSNIEFAYSQALSLLGQHEKALLYQRRSFATRRGGLGADHPDAISSRYWVAMMLYRAGQSDAGEMEARAAVDQAIAHVPQTHATYPRSLEVLGSILGRTGRRAESIGYFQRAIEVKRRTGGAGNNNFFYALNGLADSLVQLERYQDAEPLALEAAAGWRKLEGERSARAAGAMLVAGLAAAAEGRATDALTRLDGAVTLARALDAKERLIGPKGMPALIIAAFDAGRLADARVRAAAFVAETRATAASRFVLANAELLDVYVRGGAAAPAARAVVAAIGDDRVLAESGELPQDQRAALDLVLRVAVGADDPALALDAAAVLAGSRVAQAGRLVASRLRGADPALATRVRAVQDAARALKDVDGQLLKALAAGGDVAGLRGRRDEAAAGLATLEATLTRDYPQWAAASGAAAPDLARLQASLARDEALVGIVPAFDGVYTLTVTSRRAVVRRTPLGRAAILALVTRLRASLPTDRYDAAAAHALYGQFFPAADAALLRGVTSVRLVPVGPVAQVPFAALLTRAAPGAGGAGRDAPWLIRRFALEVAPSFAPSAQAVVSVRPARLLAVGAPTPFGTGTAAVGTARTYFRGGAADATALAALPPLPAAAREIAAAARAFGGADTLIGDDASEARLKTMDLSRFTTLLFATHGLVSGEMEGVAEPSLVLAKPRAGEGDGLLTASEVATLRLDADWVILSACNTAVGEGGAAPAYSGLAQAFRYAGARALLLSHWPVRDDAATFVTVQTVTGARAGLSRPVALQRAMLRLIAARDVPEAANPYIWAPYILLD